MKLTFIEVVFIAYIAVMAMYLYKKSECLDKGGLFVNSQCVIVKTDK